MKKCYLKGVMAFFAMLLINVSALPYIQTPVYAQSQATSQPTAESNNRDEYEETYSNGEEQTSSVINPEPPGSFESVESQLPPESDVDETSESQAASSETEASSEPKPIESSSEATEPQISPVQSEPNNENPQRPTQQQHNAVTSSLVQKPTRTFTMAFTLMVNRLYNNSMSITNWFMDLINSDTIDIISNHSVSNLPVNILSNKYHLMLLTSVYLITNMFN
ncbi:hypothetical protein [Fundicoccus culcitae]|uniref:Uncharacterized protein n=1 Tax=Fundicoccus culcitae TaxID=2969821 RepID=A0ABY5P2N3_9LACT|nr:hypothetical protein [Fundicoccus culcitae]UUX32981.1 hypothetical protein NRE15_08635 [Fundicoccus culcitae]